MKNGCRLMIKQEHGQHKHCLGSGDKVHDLHVMKLMVKKEYIFSCYETAVKMNSFIQDFNCHNQNMAEEGLKFLSGFNYHSNAPNIFCTVINHVECFDPIMR